MTADRTEETGFNRRLQGRVPILLVILLGTAAISLTLRASREAAPIERMQANAARNREWTSCSAKVDRIVQELVAFYRTERKLPGQAEFQAILREKVDPVTVCPNSPKTTLVIGPEGYFFVLACPENAPCENLIEPLWEVANTHLPYLRNQVSFDAITARPLMIYARSNIQKLSDMEGLGDDDEELAGFNAMKADILGLAGDFDHIRVASLTTGIILYKYSDVNRK